MATTYISRSVSSTGNRKTWTLSFWIKKSRIRGTGSENIFSANDGTNFSTLYFENDALHYYDYVSGNVNDVKTNRVFRDPSAWYHIVFRYDSTQSTSGDRIRIYVNGVEETSFSVESQPSLNYDSFVNNSGDTNYIGTQDVSGGADFFDGTMSHIQLVDGTSLAPTEFGSFDATDGMWKIKTAAYGTPGTNGFFLKMEDSTNMDLDSSSNGFTFSTTGTLTATKDNPSNNFCTFNSSKKSTDGTNTFSNGNTIFSNTGGTGWHQSGGTLEATAGKYYYEADINYTPGSLNTQFGWGATDMQQITKNLNNPLGKLDTSGGSIVNYAPSTGFYDTGAYMYSTTSSQDNQVNSSFAAATSGSVIMIAIDLDNGKFYVGKDGTWDSTSSSNPSAGTGGKSFTPGGFSYSPWVASYNAGPISINFGNGYFGSTVIGSAVSAGEGLWKYTPPTNYGAFCTKNINAA